MVVYGDVVNVLYISINFYGLMLCPLPLRGQQSECLWLKQLSFILEKKSMLNVAALNDKKNVRQFRGWTEQGEEVSHHWYWPMMSFISNQQPFIGMQSPCLIFLKHILYFILKAFNQVYYPSTCSFTFGSGFCSK